MAALSTAYYYATGSVSVASGGTTVTGAGTLWSALVKAGDLIELSGLQARIKEVVSDTALTLLLPWPGAAQSGAAYAITFGSPTRFEGAYVAESARTLIAKLGIIDDAVPYYAVKSVGTNAPPASPVTGDSYVIGTVPSGVWVGYVGYIARWSGTAWVYTPAAFGMIALDQSTGYTYMRGASDWVATPNTTSEIMNALASAVPALWWLASGYQLDATAAALVANAVTQKCMISGASVAFDSLFVRTGGSKIVEGADGGPTVVAANAPAYNYASGQRRYLLEGTATKLLFPNAAPTAAFTLTVTAQSYTLSFWGTGTYALSGAHTATVTGTGANVRTKYTFTPTAGSLTLTPSGSIAYADLEPGSVATSSVVTTSSAVTRAADVCQWSSAAAALLSAGGPNTIALRASVLTRIAAQNIISGPSGSILLRSSTSESSSHQLILAGAASGIMMGSSVLPGTFGAVMAWDAAGRSGAMSGGVGLVGDATPLTMSTSSMYFGSYSGMQAGTRLEISELCIWPRKGSGSAIQSQAHVYGA